MKPRHPQRQSSLASVGLGWARQVCSPGALTRRTVMRHPCRRATARGLQPQPSSRRSKNHEQHASHGFLWVLESLGMRHGRDRPAGRLAGTIQLGRSCWLDLLAQILRRSLVTGLVPARASLTPRIAQASASPSRPSPRDRPRPSPHVTGLNMTPLHRGDAQPLPEDTRPFFGDARLIRGRPTLVGGRPTLVGGRRR